MKTALVSTTITPPYVLPRYRQCDPGVHFYVAGDYGCNDAAIQAICDDVGNATYLSYEAQEALGYQCHGILGRRVIQRRNIAILEAIKSGADIVVTIDTDNVCSEFNYFSDIRLALSGPCGRQVSAHYGPMAEYFNPGRMAQPEPYVCRGFPLSYWYHGRRLLIETAWHPGVQNGIVSGLILDDPDTSAIERIDREPRVSAYDLPGFTVSVDPTMQWAPINSQNTAYVRELTPLMAVLPGLGRGDDIFGGYIAQRVLADTEYKVAFGRPFAVQARHPHNLLDDLEQEMFTMRHTERFCADLKALDLSDADTILGKLELVYEGIARMPYMPSIVAEFGFAWCVDCARVMGAA